MNPDANEGRIEIDRDTSRPWVMVAQSARMMRDLLRETPPAREGSGFAITDEDMPEPSEKWCRAYLTAALEHLVMWADFAVPLVVHPDSVVHHEARPAQTLARAAVEAASQAVWIMAAKTAPEMMRRHISLVLADWEEQRKAAIDQTVKDELKERRVGLLKILEGVKVKVDDPSYLTLVTKAAEEVRNNLTASDLGDAAQVERLWRASAGSAHGKMWPAIELRVTMEAGGRTYSFPDADAMSAMLMLADRVTQYGVFRFIDRAGHEPELAERLGEIGRRWYARIPKIPGAPERLEDAPPHLREVDSAGSTPDLTRPQ